MIRLFFISIVIVFLSACSTIEPSITEYRIIANNIISKSDLNGCKNKSLKVAQAFSSSSLMSLKMDYVLLNNKTFSYSQARWSDTPNRAISLELLQVIRDSGLFKYTQSAKTRSKSDFILETYIEDFVQYYSNDLSKSYVKILISSSLIDLKTNSIISAKTFKTKVESTSADAIGGVKALNKALSDILMQNTDWLSEICK